VVKKLFGQKFVDGPAESLERLKAVAEAAART
jgi:hypothetical protein